MARVSSAGGPWLYEHSPRRASWGLDRTAPPGMPWSLGGSPPRASARALGSATPSAPRCRRDRGWTRPGTPRDRAGAVERQGGRPVARRPPRLPPGAAGWQRPPGGRRSSPATWPVAGGTPGGPHPSRRHAERHRVCTSAAGLGPRAWGGPPAPPSPPPAQGAPPRGGHGLAPPHQCAASGGTGQAPGWRGGEALAHRAGLCGTADHAVGCDADLRVSPRGVLGVLPGVGGGQRRGGPQRRVTPCAWAAPGPR